MRRVQEFSCPTRVVTGAGAAEALARFGAKRVLVVTSHDAVRTGAALRIAAHAGDGERAVFDDIAPLPTAAEAAAGAALLRRFRPDLVLACGGENVLDCAKVMCCCARTDAPLVTVPTVPDGGAALVPEATLRGDGRLLPLSDSRLRPHMAIYDTAADVPARVLAENGFAALCCALEAAVAVPGGAFSALLAREGFTRLFARLPAAYAGRTDGSLAEASALVGLARCGTGLGLCRAIAQSLALHSGVNAARVSAALLPGVLHCNALAARSKYARLARAAGFGGSTDEAAVKNLCAGLLRVRRELGLPQTLAQAGVAPQELCRSMSKIVETVLCNPNCRTNPMPPEAFWVRRILQETGGN